MSRSDLVLERVLQDMRNRDVDTCQVKEMSSKARNETLHDTSLSGKWLISSLEGMESNFLFFAPFL